MRAIQISLPWAARVLDLGCGSGWVLAEAKCPNDCTRIGVDYSWEALRAGGQYSQMRFAVADGVRLPFAPDTFDVAVGHVSTPYMNTAEVLEEVCRVLIPGGSFLLTFHSFAYVRQRFFGSVRRGNWKDILFCAYIAVNGVLNHLSLPQTRTWWNRARFETVNTPLGVARTARAHGFELVSAEQEPSRIFFVVTGRKPNRRGEAVLAAPAWAAYCPLAARLEHNELAAADGKKAGSRAAGAS